MKKSVFLEFFRLLGTQDKHLMRPICPPQKIVCILIIDPFDDSDMSPQ